MFTWSETWRTFSSPWLRPDLDLLPISYQDSIPGSSALNPMRFIRFRRVSDSSDKDDSARCETTPGGTDASMVSISSSNRMPKFGSCQPITGRRILVVRNLRSAAIWSSSSGWKGIEASMQKLQV